MRLPISTLLAVVTLVVTATSQANAAFIPFIPPNDTVGSVFSTNSNDGYSNGRGIVFQMTANTVINSVGIFQDLTGITLNYKVAQITTVVGQVDVGETILQSGSGTFTTSGLQFIDFGFSNLLLQSGNAYQIQFSFNGSSNQNFFYNNGNVPWTQGAFTSLEGTQNGNTNNFVVPAIRVNTASAPANAVPAPQTIVLAMTALPLIGGFLRRQRMSKTVSA